MKGPPIRGGKKILTERIRTGLCKFLLVKFINLHVLGSLRFSSSSSFLKDQSSRRSCVAALRKSFPLALSSSDLVSDRKSTHRLSRVGPSSCDFLESVT